MFFNNKDALKITGIIVRILLVSAFVFAAIQRAEAAVWTSINGRVLTQTGDPVCAMVLANGQHMFSCDGVGTYNLTVPLDSNNLITLQVFAAGFAPFKQTLTAGQAVNHDVNMDRDTTGRAFTITHVVSAPLPNGRVTVSGNIDHNGTPLCAMILINGQNMFSCNQNLGSYSLEVPRDSNGKITLQAFAAGFMPHRDTFGVNDPPIATGQCGTTFQAVTYSSTLNATDPESTQLTYALIDPSDGTPAGTGPIDTTNGGWVEITDPTTGDYEYHPNQAAGDNRGRDSFQYQVTDTGPGNLSDMATEIVIVNQTIMPLGDSITSGTGSDTFIKTEQTGYRRTLQQNLTAAGYTFDFVGGDSQGIAAIPSFDYNNEGHGGWSAAQLRDGGGQTGDPTDGTDEETFRWLETNPADIVLLHAGTNGLASDGSNADDVAGLNSIISEIGRWEESTNGNPVTIILALIINQAPVNPDITAFNDALQLLVMDRIAIDGYDIIEVNMQTGAGLVYEVGVDMWDQLHPNDSGYSKMATVWSGALTGVMDKCP